MGTYTGTPRTWVDAETVDAALMNSDIRDPLTALAAVWTSYVPTLSVFTLGNGTITGYYQRFGKTVDFICELTFGSTTTAATGYPTFSLPVTGARNSPMAKGLLYDASGTLQYEAHAYLSTSSALLAVIGTNGLRTNCSTTVPFTWTTSDVIRVAGRYEAA